MSYFKFHPSHRLPVPFPCFMSFLLCRTNRSCFLSSIPLNCRCHEAGVSLCVCCVPVLKSASAWPGCLKPIFARPVFRTLARPSQAGPVLPFWGFFPPIASSMPPSAYLPLANCILVHYTPPPSPHTCCSSAWNSFPLSLSLPPLVPLPQPHSPCSYTSFKAQLECQFLPNAHRTLSPWDVPTVRAFCAGPAAQPCSGGPALLSVTTCLVDCEASRERRSSVLQVLGQPPPSGVSGAGYWAECLTWVRPF